MTIVIQAINTAHAYKDKVLYRIFVTRRFMLP